MTSNSNFPFRSVRLGLAFIFILFMAVASWATDVTYTYTMSWKENVLRYTGTITSNTGEISNNFSSDNRVDNVLLKGNESASITEEYFSIKFACFRDVYKGSVNNTFRVTHSDAEFTITINNKNNNSYKIRKVTFKKSDGEEITSVTHVSTQSSASVALLPNTEFSTIVVELTDKPYYSVTPAEGLAISNTDGFVVDGTTYFHPATTITIAPTSAVQVITATNGTENTATIASDKRSFSFAMPSQAITPSATLEEAHVVALSGNVSISEPLFTYDGDNYYKSGDKITITATKTNEIIDAITGIADYAIAADKKSATFTMPTSDLTLAATTSEVHTVSVPTNLTISKEYITIGSIKYYKTGVTYTLAVANATHMIDEITGVTSSIAADKRSATFKMPSGNATIAATTYEVHSISVPNALSISSDPYATVGVSKYYKTGTKITLSLAADDLNRVIKTFNASGAVSPSIAEGLRSATLTVGTQDITVSATLLTIGGTCGSGTIWRMTDEDKNGSYETLNIGGTGALTEYADGNAPWYSDFRTTITRVNIGNDITTIPANPFYGIGNEAPIVLSTPALALKFKDAAFASKLRVPFGKYLFKATETADKKPAYDIATADDLRHLAAAVNANNSGSGKTFFQTANIDLASVGNFKPIGYADSTTFAGTYDGKRHVISGLKVSGSLNYAGLFGTVSGEIKNVILMNPSVSSSNNGADVGAIIGKLTGNASNCYFYGGNRSNAIGKMSKSAEVSNVSQAYTLKVGEHFSGDKLADDPENGFQYDADNDGTPENYYRDGLELTLSHDETIEDPAEGSGYVLTYLLNGQKNGNISGNKLTVGSATDGKTLSAAIRSDDQTHEITYIDANGTEKTAQAIALDGTESTLKAGWYFVGRDIAYDHALSLSETVTFILGDGKTMNVDATSSEAIFAERNFTIYGQSGQSGILKASAKGQNSNGIINTSGDIVIRGGNVTAIGESFGINGHKNITISGGEVSATGGKYGIYSYGNITLSWTNSTDRITASSYKLGSNAGHVIIPNGKYLKDEKGNVYSDKLDANQLSSIAGKTLTPTIPVHYIDENGKKQTIYNYTVLTKDMDVGSLTGGWFVVESEVNYTNTVTFSEDANLILADGAKMEIKTEGTYKRGISANGNLTIYGQVNQRGILEVTAKGASSAGIYNNKGNVTISGGDVTAIGGVGGYGIYSNQGDVTINGGNVTATGIKGIYSIKDLTISGGVVKATGIWDGISSNGRVTISGGIVTAIGGGSGSGIISPDGNVTISGGNVTATGKYSIYGKNVTISGGYVTATGETGYGICAYNGDITISWTNSTDAVKASSYYLKNSKKHVIISNGKSFKDEDGNAYGGTLSNEQLSAIADKKLEPCYAVALDLQDGKDPVKLPATFDKNGVAHVAKPDDPTRSGYTFAGWFTAKDGDTEFDFSAAITANMTAYAKWSVPYIDEDGNEKVRKPGEYTVLTSTTDVSNLTGGWYVEEGKVRYTNTVQFSEDAHLILADGAEMAVELSSGDAIHADKNLSIYGQSGRSGILAATSEYNNGISIGGEITIAGGNVTISGGNVSLDNVYYGINSHGDVTITGGNVTATSGEFYGIYSDVGNISLSWNNSADNIKVDGGFRFNSDAGHVVIPEGKAFTDEDGKVYSGTLTNEQVNAINYKSLSPFTGIFVAFVDKQGDKEVTVAAIPVGENGHVATPYEPMRSGYTFMGWYTTADGDTEFNFANITASTTAYAKWEENALVEYIDENGKTKSTKDYVLLTSNMDVSKLSDGWYVVKGEVSYTNPVTFSADAYLILADGAKMTVDVSSGDAINAIGNFTIYGQSGQRGILVASAKGEKSNGIKGNNVTITGGNVTATGYNGIKGNNNVAVTGGNVTATGSGYGIYSNNGVTITGGNVTATSNGPCIWSKFGDITLSLNSGYIKAGSYGSERGSVKVAKDKLLKDDYGNVYSGTLTKEQLSAIKDKKLEPCYAVALDLQDGKDPVKLPAIFDENGVAHVVKPDDPTRSGFNFIGWFTAKDGDTEFDFSAAITGNTTAYAKWSVNYIDENGNEQIRNPGEYTVLTKNTNVGSLTGGWYVVEGEVRYTNKVKFSDDAYLILVDDSKLTVDVANGSAVFVSGSLSIYGQSGQSGILETTAGEDGSGIAIDGDIMISGVVVKATGAWGGINSNRVTINGGSVTATNEIGYGIYAYDGDITISWTNSTDAVKASSYYLNNSEKHVIIADGKSFKDEDGNVYSGTLNDEQLSAIRGKKLMPCYAVTLDLQDGKAPVMLPAAFDKNDDAHVVTKPNDPTRSGFNFLGWFTAADGDTKFDFSAAITANTTAYAKWSVNYIDENGIEKSVAEYTVLTQNTDVSKLLPSGWYVVEGEVSYTNTVVFSNDAYLILADGAKLEIKTEGLRENGIDVSGNLAIYGQSGQSGILADSAKGSSSNGIKSSGNVTISGITVTATGDFNGISSSGNVTISGGNVTATGNDFGIYSYKDITLGWTNSTDRIQASKYGSPNGNVIIAEGQAFKDENDYVYSGTLSAEQIIYIRGKTLSPLLSGVKVAFVDTQDGKEVTVATRLVDETGHVTALNRKPRSGYTFVGWFTTAEGNTKFDFASTITADTTVYAKWVKNAPVEYIDEQGDTQTVTDYVLLTENTDLLDALPGGWYVVQGKVSYNRQVEIGGDMNLILADGAKMDVENGSDAIYIHGNLTIYGQSGQSGILTVASKGAHGIYCYGDNEQPWRVRSFSSLEGFYGLRRNNGSGGYVTIAGGNVTVTGEITGIYGSNDITLSLNNNSSSFIKASSYYSELGHVIIPEGKSLKDEDGNEYSGTLNDEQLSAIKGKTLTPVLPAPVNYIDENGNEKSINNYTVLTADMAANELPGGWYVVENSDPNGVDVSLSSTLSFSGDVNLILADDAELNISGVNGANSIVIDGDAIDVAGKLTVYGQSNQTGSIFADAGKNGIYAKNGTVINGGSVKAYGTSGKGFKGTLDIHFKHYKNSIVASSFDGSVTVSGLALTESSKKGIYEGDLDENQVTVLNKIAENSLLLEPCYVVKFDKDNGSNPEFLPATFDKNGVAHVARPADPTRIDNSFLGWFNLDNTKFDFDAPVTANTEVFAHWEKDVLTVTFDTQDGRDPVIVKAEYDDNGKAYVAKPEVPTREGYTFLEWVYIPDGSASENPVYKRFDFTAPVTANMTVYAKWWKNDPVEYSVAGQVNSIGQYTVLTSWTNVSESLPAGWYVVVNSNTDNGDDNGVDVRFTENLSFGSGVTRIILLDGAEMVVSDGVNSTIYADVLNVYGQTGGTGKLSVNSGNKGIEATNVNIYGGVVDATGAMAGIYSSRTVSIYGGKVSVPKTSLYGIYVDMGDIALDWNNDGDRYTIGDYTLLNGSVIIAENKYFTDDDGNVYKGKLNDEQIAAIKGKTLKPANAVSYIDENGKEKFVTNYTVLTSDVAQTDENGVITLPAGWYVVQENVVFANRIAFAANDAGSKDVHLILADDAKMKVETEFSYAIGDSTFSTLTIYGQKNQSGVLEVSSEFRTGIYSYKGSIAIVGGHVNVNGENGIEANYVTIAGGNVEAKGDCYGISSVDGITLSWMNSTDAVKASSYDGTVTIAAGKAFKDEDGNEYRGTLEAEQITAIKGKKLVPLGPKSLTSEDIVITDIPVQNYDKDNPVCPDTVIVTDGDYVLKDGKDYTFECGNNTEVSSATLGSSAPYVIITGMGNYDGEIQKRFYIWKNIGNYAAVQVYKDNGGVTHAEIDGDYTGKDAVNIPNDIKVDMVKFNRKFTVTKNGGFSTLMLPFSVKSVYVKGVEGFYKFAYVADCSVKKDGKNDVCVNKVWENTDSVYVTLEANTPYMVKMKESTLRINTKVTLAKTSGGTLYDSRVDTEEEGKATWQMRGVFGYKEWACNDADLGKVWGYAGEPRKDVYIGKYVQFGPEVWINPFRAYLYDPNGEKMQCTAKPKAVAYAKAYTAEFMPAQSKAAANATNAAASSEVASIDEFGGMQVVIVEDGNEKSIAGGKEHTTTVGRKNPAVTEIRVKPRTSQTYDLKGRRVGNGKKAKGAYYRR